MQIGYVMAPGRGDVDLILQAVADQLLEQGLRPGGVVQTNTECAPDGPCDMDVRVLPAGPVLRISQSLGAQSKGCRLDASALERAVGLVEASLAEGLDCLIVNKFGKHEASGRGFRATIGQALERGLPVLVGLNALNEAAFQAFAQGAGEALAPEPEALAAWVTAAVAAAAEG